MVMVVTVMAADLHLVKTVRANPGLCQPALCVTDEALCVPGVSSEIGFALVLQQLDNPLIKPVAQFEALRCACHVADFGFDARV
jgi:hypothetical protein